MLLTRNLRSWIIKTLIQLQVALFDWRPFGLIILMILLLGIVTQVPVSYNFKVGYERGSDSDQPFLQSFYPTEGEWPDQLFRWSRTEWATIALPGVGKRAVALELQIASHRSQHNPTAGSTLLTLPSDGNITPPRFQLRAEAAHYLILLPAEALPYGGLNLRLDTPTWQNQGDSRDEIGVALAGQVRLSSLRSSGFVQPDQRLLLGLPVMLLLLWAMLRLSGFAAQTALFMLLPVAVLVPGLLLVDPARFGFIGAWSIPFGLLALAGAGLALLLIPPFFRRIDVPLPALALRWLALATALTFALKYGGRLYPDAMPGDWQLHINRFNATGMGMLAIQAKHRGLPFPFPTGFYLDIAPLILSGIEIRPILPILAGLFEALSIPVIYAIPARTLGPRVGLYAMAIYTVTATGFMNTWFSFHTQVSTQAFTAMLVLLLVLGWPNYQQPKVWWPILFLLLQQFLGHIGTFINAGLLGVLAVAALFVRARTSKERGAAIALLFAGIVAIVFALLCFYTLFTGLILEQIQGVASQGLVGVSGKKPLDRWDYLQVLWEGGLITHYGFFPVLLAIPGALAISRRLKQSALPVLIWGTLLISLAQGGVPLLTRSAIMTRWLTFAAWAIAVAGGMGLALWLRRGRAARIMAYAMAGYVAWITAMIIAQAMTERLPPIEPF